MTSYFACKIECTAVSSTVLGMLGVLECMVDHDCCLEFQNINTVDNSSSVPNSRTK